MKIISPNARLTLPAVFLVAVILTGCGSSGDRRNAETVLPGAWEALWTLDTAGGDWPQGMTVQMSGIIRFGSDGKAEIQAYGYEGCALAADTLNHQVYWKILDDKLSFSDDPEHPGLMYNILDINPGKIELQLMDEIRLRLRRP